jgi:hypothetical protein
MMIFAFYCGEQCGYTKGEELIVRIDANSECMKTVPIMSRDKITFCVNRAPG